MQLKMYSVRSRLQERLSFTARCYTERGYRTTLVVNSHIWQSLLVSKLLSNHGLSHLHVKTIFAQKLICM